MRPLDLCVAIGMPEEVTERLGRVRLDGLPSVDYVRALTEPDEYEKTATRLSKRLKPDEGGWKMLAVQLHAACLTYVKYLRSGIDERVFSDTMGCFSRFLREHYESFGTYGFDRWWWTGRQLSMMLFRLGTLEYEIAEGPGGIREISVHIPSDAVLSDAALDDSFAAAKAFFAQYKEGAYKDAAYSCTSWLLSPALDDLLPEDAGIRRFARRFRIEKVIPEDESYRLWVYKKADLAPEDFPENTSLQRNLKKFVLGGGKVGEARGILCE